MKLVSSTGMISTSANFRKKIGAKKLYKKKICKNWQGYKSMAVKVYAR